MQENINEYTGCGAIIIRNEDSKVFIGKRKLTKNFGGGLWETIGGGIEKKDSDFLSCIQREIMEELQAEVKNAKQFRDYIIKSDNNLFKIKMFIVELLNEPNPNKNDFEDWGWFDENQISNLYFVSNCKDRLKDYFLFRKLT